MANVVTRGRNVVRQALFPSVKIFFIGFNKCGTTAIHRLMKSASIRSVHWQHKHENIAASIEGLLDDRKRLRDYLSRWTAYSDLISAPGVEANRHFRLFHELYPSSYFILNDRDPERWLASRRDHKNGRFLQQCMKLYDATEEGVLDIWRSHREEHGRDVLKYFDGDYDRFLHFRVDVDPIEKLIHFLSPDFAISESDWRVHNETRERDRVAV